MSLKENGSSDGCVCIIGWRLITSKVNYMQQVVQHTAIINPLMRNVIVELIMTLKERIRYNRLSRIHDVGQSRLYAWIMSIIDEIFK